MGEREGGRTEWGGKERAKNTVQGFHMGCIVPGTWALSAAISGHDSRKLDWKQSSLDSADPLGWAAGGLSSSLTYYVNKFLQV